MAARGGYKQFGSEADHEQTTKQLVDSGKHSATVRTAGRERIASSEDDLRPSGSTPSVAVQVPARRMEENSRLGPYQLVCELASGGMATVYLALYRSIEGFEKLCAVKRIHPHLAGDRSFAEMFVDEAQIAARISHPNVCSVFSFGKSQNSHYIAMEFLRGEPLSAVSRKVARAPQIGDDPRFPAIAARLIANFAEGLHAAHTLKDDRGAALDIVHRDVTPQNLFVLFDGSVRVTDFGIAHARQRLHHTEGQKLKGKLSYIAPEQLSEGPLDLRVDVWGLGVTLWELLAGRRLFLGSNEGETLAAVSSRAVRPPSELRASVPAELDRIVLRALERDRQKRYRTARDLARDLERFLASCADPVPAMDVADWMTQLFPRGADRIQALMELAAEVSLSSREETVLRVPSSAPPPGVASLDAGLRLFPTPAFSSQPPADGERAPPSGKEELTPEPTTQRPSLSLRVDEPRLILEEQSETSAYPAVPVRPQQAGRAAVATPAVVNGTSQKLAVVATGLLVAVAIAAATLLGRPAPATPTPPRQSQAKVEAPVAVLQPVALPAPVTASAAPNLGLGPVEAEAPSSSASPLVTKARPTSPPRAVVAPRTAAPAPAPALAAPSAMGDIFISTPGGSWEVLEQGRTLGRTPGSFRLSAGEHVLVLRGSNGVEHRFSTSIAPNAPKVVTLPLGQ